MIQNLVATSMLLPAVTVAAETPMPAGKWDIRFTNVEMSIPGMPAFIARLMRGRSKVEPKRLTTGQGIEALLAPDPKANCRVTFQQIAGVDTARHSPARKNGAIQCRLFDRVPITDTASCARQR